MIEERGEFMQMCSNLCDVICTQWEYTMEQCKYQLYPQLTSCYPPWAFDDYLTSNLSINVIVWLREGTKGGQSDIWGTLYIDLLCNVICKQWIYTLEQRKYQLCSYLTSCHPTRAFDDYLKSNLFCRLQLICLF